MNKTRMFFLVTITIWSAGSALGEDFIWRGLGADTDWRTANNWDKTGYPGTGDKATFESGANDWPTFSNDETVAFLVIKGNAELTVSGATLTVEEPDGLTVESAGELNIDAGTLKLLGGGIISLDGPINMDGTGATAGILLLSETTGEVYVVPSTPTEESGIFGLVGGTSVIRGIGDAVLVIEEDIEIAGELTVELALVNNGEVHANVDGPLTLACNEKSGNGVWKVSTHANAQLVSNVPVSGGPCAIVHIARVCST